MGLNLEGFEDLSDKMDNLERNAKELVDNRSVPLEEVFTEGFMTAHTRFGSIDDFLEAGGFVIETDADFEAIPREALDPYVHEATSFDSFQQMLDKAVGEYIMRRLGF